MIGRLLMRMAERCYVLRREALAEGRTDAANALLRRAKSLSFAAHVFGYR